MALCLLMSCGLCWTTASWELASVSTQAGPLPATSVAYGDTTGVPQRPVQLRHTEACTSTGFPGQGTVTRARTVAAACAVGASRAVRGPPRHAQRKARSPSRPQRRGAFLPEAPL